MLSLSWQGHSVELRDEPTYTPGSTDNPRSYGHHVFLGVAGDRIGSRYGVIVGRDSGDTASCAVLATGGITSVQGRSGVVLRDKLFLAIGNRVCALELPSLALDWHIEADAATCFGVLAVPGDDGLISHGELEIARLTLEGSILWRQAGRDIFTGELSIEATQVHVTDWNGDRYAFDLVTGEPIGSEA